MERAASEEQIVHTLNKIEKLICQDDFMSNGIHFWPIIKVNLFFQLMTQNNQFKKKNSWTFFLQLSLACLFGLVQIPIFLINVFLANNKTKWIHFGDATNRQFRINNKPIDIYLTPLAHFFARSIQNLSLFNIETRKSLFSKHSNFTSAYSVDWIRVVSTAAAYFAAPFFSNNIFPQSKKLSEHLEQSDFSTFLLQKNELNKLIISTVIQYHLYKSILNVLSPKFASVVCYYNKFAFVAACKACRIPIFDIQHGMQEELHIAYGWWSAPNSNTLPTLFWNWTEEHKKLIESWGGCSFVGGVPIFRFLDQEQLQDKQIRNQLSHLQSQKKRILISLQWGGYFPLNVINKIISSKRYKYLVRIHPCMSTQEKKDVQKIVSDLFAKGFDVELDSTSKLPLLLVLKNIDLHVTATSSVILEAAYLGIHTLSFDSLSKEYYKNEVQSKKLSICSEPEISSEIDNCIEITGKMKHQQAAMNYEATDSFFDLINRKSNTK